MARANRLRGDLAPDQDQDRRKEKPSKPARETGHGDREAGVHSCVSDQQHTEQAVPCFANWLLKRDAAVLRGARVHHDGPGVAAVAVAAVRARGHVLQPARALCLVEREGAACRVRVAELAAGRAHLEFCVKLYELQVRSGRFFVHEHPAGATSWQLDCVRKLLDEASVARVNGDQCQYGQADESGRPIRKATGWMSNSSEVLRMLEKKCPGRRQRSGPPAPSSSPTAPRKCSREKAISDQP